MSAMSRDLGFRPLAPAHKYNRVVPGLLRRIRELYTEIYRRFGDEGLALIREVSHEYGRQIAIKTSEKRSIKGVEAVGRYLMIVFDMVTPDWDVAQFDEDRLVIRVSQCPYPFTDSKICEAHTTMEKALVETLDPSLDYRIGCSVAKGDEYCDHILAKRGAAE
jgi:hypothetical protein